MSLLLLLWPLALIQRPEAESPLWARRSLILLISALTLRYLHWRCTASLNLDSPLSTGLSGLLLLAEGWLLRGHPLVYPVRARVARQFGATVALGTIVAWIVISKLAVGSPRPASAGALQSAPQSTPP